MSFKKLKKEIREWLEQEGFGQETPIQKKTMEAVMGGKDVLITAPTGHGKTLAAILPLFNKYSRTKKSGIKILYICPLKALNRDILRRISGLGSRIWMDVDIRHGDTKQKIRTLQSKIPPDVLITTPETLQAILTGKRLRKHLEAVEAVVIDEVHEMVDNKRGAQLSLGLERLRVLAKDFQTIGVSATIGDREKVSKFISDECITIEAGGSKDYDISIELCRPRKEDVLLSQELMVNPITAAAIRRINELLGGSRSAIIFTNTREASELLGAKIKRIRDDVEVHHSSLSRDIRISAEKRMKLGELKAIIATSSLELGIDIGHVDLVIQYMSPRQVTKLAQRVGRSGHRVGKTSRGVILTTSREDSLEAEAILSKLNQGWLEKAGVMEKPYDVLCHQIVGFCMDLGEVDPDFIFSRIKKSYVFRGLDREEFDRVLDLARRIGHINFGKNGIYRTRAGLKYYFQNLSMIPDEKTYFVIDEQDNSRVGILHQGFVAQHVSLNSKFIMNGRVWRVTETKDSMVYVVREKSERGALPSWEGELIPVPREIAERFAESVGEGGKISVERRGEFLAIYTWFGSKANNALGSALGAVLSQEAGTSVGVKTDPYAIVLKSPTINEKTLEEYISSGDWVDGVLKSSLPNSSLFSYRFWHIARRFGIIKKDAEVNKNRIEKLISIFRNSPVVEETFREIFFDKMDVSVLGELMKRPLEFREWRESTEEKITRIHGYVRVSDEMEILDKVLSRLMSKRFFFQCTNCWEKMGSFSIENIPKKCSNCGSKLLGFVPSHQKEIVTKSVLRKSAPVFLQHGRDACLVMAGFGIGPKTATRILSIPYSSERELVKRVVEAEREFLRTRRFWGENGGKE